MNVIIWHCNVKLITVAILASVSALYNAKYKLAKCSVVIVTGKRDRYNDMVERWRGKMFCSCVNILGLSKIKIVSRETLPIQLCHF